MARREWTREDLKWGTNTKHHIGKADGKEGFVFCVELDTHNKDLAVARSLMLIELLASWGQGLRKAGEQAGHFRPALIKK